MAISSWLSALPGPPPAALVGWRGNQLRYFRDPIGYIEPFLDGGPQLLAFCRNMSGGLFLRAGAGAVIAVGPQYNHAVLTQPDVYRGIAVEGPSQSRSLGRLVSGIFGINGDRHRQQRRLLQPAFHRKQIETYHAAVVEPTQKMLDHFVVGQPRQLLHDLQELTLTIATKILFGLGPSKDSLAIGKHIQELLLMLLSPRWRLPALVPGSTRTRLCALADRLEQELCALLAKARDAGSSDDSSALALLLRSKSEDGATLGEDELLGNCFALFFAGYETTTSALAWTLLLLSQHPAIEHALREELQGVLHGDPPRPEQLQKLPLLDQVVKESLRLLPPAPLMVRTVATPTELLGVALPAGAEVILSIYHTHRLRESFSEPQRFLPRRWETLEPAPYAYLPFGGGARMCLGATLAPFELKLILAMLVQRYRLELLSGARIDRHVTIVMRPRAGLPMVVHGAPGAGSAASPLDSGGPRRPPSGDIQSMVQL